MILTYALLQVSVSDLIQNAKPIPAAVELTLILLSVISWGIIFNKWKDLRSGRALNRQFLAAFRQTQQLGLAGAAAISKQFEMAPLSQVFAFGYNEVDRQVRQHRCAFRGGDRQYPQASGLPVVGFDCQGPNERVTAEVDGLLIPMGGDMEPALRRLCEDSGLRERIEIVREIEHVGLQAVDFQVERDLGLFRLRVLRQRELSVGAELSRGVRAAAVFRGQRTF